MPIYLNKDYEIYDSDGNAALKVNCSDDQVRVCTAPDEKSKEWFGDIDFMLTFEAAEALAKAIQFVVNDKKETS